MTKLKIKLLPLTSILLSILFLLLFFAPISNVKAAEKTVLNVFSWEDYIDEDLIGEFEEEYPNIDLNYYTFATNEEMYNEVVKNPKSCDVLCPSEYMILKMKQENLIKPYQMPSVYNEYASPYIKEVFESLGLNNADGTTYATGYMWGTMGFIYNMDAVDVEDISSWKGLLDKKYKNKSTIKDSLRDTYILALGILYEEELLQAKNLPEEEYKAKVFEIFNRKDPETIEKATEILLELKSNLYGFEVDSGKSDILTGKITINFAWSGDAAYSIFEADESSSDIRLGYVVPEEGSNVWFDGWVMTKNANEDASSKFINFISKPENAVRNISYVGYTSCIAGQDVFDYAVECYGADYFPYAQIEQEEYNSLLASEKRDYVAFDGGYALKDDGYGELVEINGEYKCQLFHLDDNANRVDDEIVEVYEVNLKYFFDPTCQDDTYVIYSREQGRALYAQYADEETIMRCAVMDTFSQEDLNALNEMWNTVKLITLSTAEIIVIVAIMVLVIAGVVIFGKRDKIFSKSYSAQKETHDKKGNKILKIENID
ncbi:MAG: extracellular solute-binding protein [Clostridia bacterium]|nr:extracellular solute-binding protein [Clostridia bacterium]